MRSPPLLFMASALPFAPPPPPPPPPPSWPPVQALATQEANRAAQNRLPPLWAIAAMVVLGFNEFMAVLYNPFWLVFLLIAFLFARTVYQVGGVGG